MSADPKTAREQVLAVLADAAERHGWPRLVEGIEAGDTSALLRFAERATMRVEMDRPAHDERAELLMLATAARVRAGDVFDFVWALDLLADYGLVRELEITTDAAEAA